MLKKGALLERARAEVMRYFSLSESELRDLVENEPAVDEAWYAGGEKDYSVYGDVQYVAIALSCFSRYSKNSIMTFHRYCKGELFDRRFGSVLDVGAGCGITTALLAELYPRKLITYQNLPGVQLRFARKFLSGYANVEVSRALPPADLVVALELFEHVRDPVEFLGDIVREACPRHLLICNSFGSRAYGHHSVFDFAGESVSNTAMPRLFGRALRGHGFRKVKAFWNGRPTLWSRDR